MVIALAGSAGLAASASLFPAHAQTPDLNALIACREISDDTERLACFDAAIAPLPEDSTNLVVIDRTQVEAVERDGFGLELPSLPRLSLSLFSNDNELSLDTAPQSTATASANRSETSDESTVTQESEILSRTDEGEINSIRLQLSRVDRRGYNDTFFVTSNGQVWEHVGGPNLRSTPNFNRGPVYVEIRRALAGSYLLRVNGRGPAYRVVRRD